MVSGGCGLKVKTVTKFVFVRIKSRGCGSIHFLENGYHPTAVDFKCFFAFDPKKTSSKAAQVAHFQAKGLAVALCDFPQFTAQGTWGLAEDGNETIRCWSRTMLFLGRFSHADQKIYTKKM